MANRVLKRPMFRMGGSPQFEFQERTTGILSGLDGPKLNASRTGMANGGVMDESESIVFDQMMRDKKIGPYSNKAMEESGLFTEGLTGGEIAKNNNEIVENLSESYDYDDARSKAEKIYGADPETVERKQGMPGSLSSALMTFGLNLLGQPGGNLAGAIGKAGAPALEKFQRARLAEQLDAKRDARQKRSDIADIAAEIYVADKEAATDIATQKLKGTTEYAKKQAADQLTNIFQSDIKILEDSKEGKTKEEIAEIDIQIKNKKDELQDKVISILTDSKTRSESQQEILKELIKQGLVNEDKIKEIYPDLAPLFEAADGGRAGYQVGGEVVEEVASMVEAPVSPTQTQDLTYDELRARLPREITNDVVTLIATSKSALMDFANIQTQQDVDNFNQTYNVNLVLPQEG